MFSVHTPGVTPVRLPFDVPLIDLGDGRVLNLSIYTPWLFENETVAPEHPRTRVYLRALSSMGRPDTQEVVAVGTVQDVIAKITATYDRIEKAWAVAAQAAMRETGMMGMGQSPSLGHAVGPFEDEDEGGGDS